MKQDLILVLTNLFLGILAIFWFGVAVLPYAQVTTIRPWWF